MGTAFGELGATQSPLWAESGCSTEIRSRFTQGTREWEMVLWASGSGSIEGHCGGKAFGRDVHGMYRARKRSGDVWAAGCSARHCAWPGKAVRTSRDGLEAW